MNKSPWRKFTEPKEDKSIKDWKAVMGLPKIKLKMKGDKYERGIKSSRIYSNRGIR